MLFDFLKQTAHDNIDVLVLNGDIYDFWLVPLNQSTPSLSYSVNNGVNPAFQFDFDTFHKLVRHAARSVVTLHESNGNHDSWLTDSLASQALNHQAVDDNVNLSWTENAVDQWGVRFEHGHAHSIFEMPLPGSDKMPIGYYVTRCVASYACATTGRLAQWKQKVIKEVLGTTGITQLTLEILRQPAVFKKLLHQILDTASAFRLPPLDQVSVVGVIRPNEIPKGGDKSANYTLNHFVDDYAGVLGELMHKLGSEEVYRLLTNDVLPGELDRDAGARSVNESVIVLGHTHTPEMQVVKRDDPHRSRTPDVLVTNAGAWVPDDQGKQQHSYVDMEIDDLLEDFPECYTESKGIDYRGTVSHTVDGAPCLHWGSDTPFKTKYQKAFGKVAFCRNLGDTEAPWCYTGFHSWGKCDVGQPAKKCEAQYERGAVKVDLFTYPNKKPMASATRNPSSGSSWVIAREKDSEDAAIVV